MEELISNWLAALNNENISDDILMYVLIYIYITMNDFVLIFIFIIFYYIGQQKFKT